MSDVWVECWFSGKVPMDSAADFMERVADYAKRFGLNAEGGAIDGDDYPGTSAILGHLVGQMAAERGVPVKQVYDELADEVRGTALA